MSQKRAPSMPAGKSMLASMLVATLLPGGTASLPWYGVSGEEAGDRSGLRITAVYADSPAIGAGLHAGDIIVRINGKPTLTRVEVNQRMGETHPADKVTLTIRRGSAEMEVSLLVGRWPEHAKVAELLPAESR